MSFADEPSLPSTFSNDLATPSRIIKRELARGGFGETDYEVRMMHSPAHVRVFDNNSPSGLDAAADYLRSRGYHPEKRRTEPYTDIAPREYVRLEF
ncbi:MAG: hypothetical protein ACLP8S_11380 [Solirubrobacteraceae bacterium]